MRARQSHLLQPLTAITSTKVTFKWTYVKQQLFDKIKQIVACNTLLIYPDFNERFDIDMDASYFQSGSVISQNDKTIALYSRKFTPAQSQYTITEK